jgi:AAA+ superfamily predicted ATPase
VSKRLVAQEAAEAVGRFPARLPASNLPSATAELETLARLWERDARLSGLALYLDVSDDVADDSGELRRRVDRLLTRVTGLVFVDSREGWPTIDSGALVVDVASPTVVEQRAAWIAATGDEPLARQLVAQFDLDIVAIEALAAEFDGGDELWAAALRSTRPRLDQLAQRVDARATRDDLILPDDVAEQLERIKAQVQLRSTVHSDWGLADRTSRGLGITALFAGESGTGKTLAAEVIAGELRLDLYRIDLSAVVSKYIGETEKHLRRLFDTAERGGTVLFFDEADALFGKRSEVRDSHDRYANIEVNYLLQRMESYQGLAILATNMKSALDQAFTRRLRFVVDFPFPDRAERERIWRRSFLPAVNTGELDFSRLAFFTLTGGSIHNAAVNATFAVAASDTDDVSMPMVLAAIRLEYRKLGMTVNESDFAWADPRAIPEMSGAAS